MCPERLSDFRYQRGLGLPAALFVIVVLGLVVLAMSELQQTGTQSTNYQLLSTRAFYAAESGAQIAVHRLIPPTGASVLCTASYWSQNFTKEGLNGCSAQVTCRTDIVNSEPHYTLTSTGSCGTGIEAASRVIQVRVR